MPEFDLAIVGAGPAGMAAAAQAAEFGLRVAILDEQPRAGGQIYRDVERASEIRRNILGPDYTCGAALAAGLHVAGIEHIRSATVWAIEDGFELSYTQSGRAATLRAPKVLLATGALERPMPLPGWTLPGVMTAGAGQILLKQSGVLVQNAVLVGNGPLLYLVATQMVRAGAPPVALIETRTAMRNALRHSFGALRGWRYLVKGVGLLKQLRRARVTRYTNASDISIVGSDRAEAVRFRHRGRHFNIGCEMVLLHHGVVPNTQAARSVGIVHSWDAQQRCFRPHIDTWGESAVSGIYIAGDGAGISGAKAAELTGRLAALRLAEQMQRLSASERDRLAQPLRRALDLETAVRPFLETAYPPSAKALSPDDSTIICRCEEITAADIRSYARLGCLGPNQAKAFGRAGMGPCQGRFCGLTVTELLSQANGVSQDQTGYFRIRPPLKPVTLGELAAMQDDAD